MARTVAGTAAVAVVALLGFAGILAVVGHDDPWVLLLVAPVVVVPLAIGGLIVWRRQGNAVGWVLIADAALLGLAFAVEPYARYALVANAGSLPGGRWALLWDQADWPTLFAGATALALVFPDGRLPSRRWRPLAIFVAASFVAAIVAGMLHPDRFPAVYGTADSPLPHVQAASGCCCQASSGSLRDCSQRPGQCACDFGGLAGWSGCSCCGSRTPPRCCRSPC